MTPVRTLLFAAIVASAGLVTGCASPPGDAFADVRRTVADRTGEEIRWNRQAGDDRAVGDAVRDLLRDPLTADRAVQVALLNNRNLQATYEDVGVAQADLVQAGLLKNPVFDTAIEFGDGGSGTKLQFSVVEDFLDVFQIPLRKRVAEAQLDGVKLRVAGAVVDHAGRTRAAFYTAQGSQQLLDLRRTVARATEASYDLAKRIRAAGNSTDLDLANEQAPYEQAKLDLASAEADAARDRERLNVLMGTWGPDTRWAMAPRLPDPPPDDPPTADVERRAVERSLELATAKGAVFAAAQMLGMKQTFALLPSLEAGAASEKEDDGTWETGPTVSAAIPIFDQGQATVAAARARLAQARQRYYATAVEVRAAARVARDQLAAARARADYYRRVILPLRRRIVAQTQDRYNGMVAGAFQLLQAKRDEITAGAEYVDALRSYWMARSQLQQVLAGGVGDMGGADMKPVMNASAGDAGATHE